MTSRFPRSLLRGLMLATSLLLCACKPYSALTAEKASLEAEVVKTKEEAQFYEKKVTSLGQPVYTAQAAAQGKIQAAEKTNTELSQEISTLSTKAEKLDAAVKQLREKLAAYKAKYLP